MSFSPPAPPVSAGIRAARVGWPLVIVSWVIGTVLLLWGAFGSSLTFFGEALTVEEKATTERYLVAAAWVAVGLPLLGLVCAGLGRSRPGVWVCVVALLFGLALAGVVAVGLHRSHRDDPQPPRPRVTVCQEHSGGDTRCPGG